MLLEWILSSIALFGLGKRENVKAHGLAWVPGFQGYVQGGIADAHDRLNGKKDRKFRTVGLVLDIIVFVLALLMLICFGAMMVDIIKIVLASSESYGGLNPAELSEELQSMIESLLPSFIGMYLFLIPLAAASVIRAGFMYVTLYKTYDLCKPSSVIVALILTFLFGELARAIALLVIKDYRNDEVFSEECVSDGYNPQPLLQSENTPQE